MTAASLKIGHFESFFGLPLSEAPGRAGGYPPAPPQTRTSPIKAYGSSDGLRAAAALCGRFVHRALEHCVSALSLAHNFRIRQLPSLLPGSRSPVRLLSLGTMKLVRLPPRSPIAPFVALRRVPLG